MIQGDLAQNGLAEVLVELAEGGATGCVSLTGPDGQQGEVHLRQGRPAAATLLGPAGQDGYDGRPTYDRHAGRAQPVGATLAVLVGWERGTWRFQLEPPPDPQGRAGTHRPGTDTAALLRELSALSADDEPDAPVRAAARPAVAQRRRGLFARG